MVHLAATASLTPYLPRWTAQVRVDAGMRDPLGLTGYAHSLTGELLPGITTQTWWARYYAIYCWILWHIGEVDRPTAKSDDQRAFNRRDAAFALCSQLSGARYDGSKNTKPALAAAGKTVSLQFQILDASRYGPYGAHYAGSMYTLGLSHRPTEIRDEPTLGLAIKLAKAIDATLIDTPFHANHLWTRKHAPLDELKESAPRLSLAALRDPVCTVERRLLIDLMFGWDCPGTRGLRPQSLTMLLWLLAQYTDSGIICPWKDGERHLLYAPLYYGVLCGPDGTTAACPPIPAPLAACAGQWRRFCAHQYWTAALERLFAAMLATLERCPSGASLQGVADLWISDGIIDRLAELLGAPAQVPAALLAACAEPRKFALGGSLAETKLCPDTIEPESGLLLLAVLHARWLTTNDLAVRAVADSFCRDLRAIAERWRAPTLTWSRAIAELLEYQLLRPHELHMYDKRQPASPWLDKVGDHYIHRKSASSTFRSARIAQARSILRDLLLVERGPGDRAAITGAGREVLQRVLEVAP